MKQVKPTAFYSLDDVAVDAALVRDAGSTCLTQHDQTAHNLSQIRCLTCHALFLDGGLESGPQELGKKRVAEMVHADLQLETCNTCTPPLRISDGCVACSRERTPIIGGGLARWTCLPHTHAPIT